MKGVEKGPGHAVLVLHLPAGALGRVGHTRKGNGLRNVPDTVSSLVGEACGKRTLACGHGQAPEPYGKARLAVEKV